MAAHQASPSLGFTRQEHWNRLPFPSPMHESEKWKWSHSVMSDSSRPHGLQPTRLLCPWDFPGKSSRVSCHCLLSSLIARWSLMLYITTSNFKNISFECFIGLSHKGMNCKWFAIIWIYPNIYHTGEEIRYYQHCRIPFHAPSSPALPKDNYYFDL